MSAENSHVVVVSGATLREVSEAALAAFDAFFDREIEWSVVRMDTDAEFTEVKNGMGIIVSRQLVNWHARVEARAEGIQIGAPKQSPPVIKLRPFS